MLEPDEKQSYQWWSTTKIAEFLDISERQIRDRYSKDPSFPQARKPRLASHVGHPRWKSIEVIEWAEKYYLTDNEAIVFEGKLIGRPRKSII